MKTAAKTASAQPSESAPENAAFALLSNSKAAAPEQKSPATQATPAPSTQVGGSTGGGISNFESELRAKRKKTRTSFAGDTGGYGGNTNLG